MHTTFHKIENNNAPKLKNPHFIVDYEFKHVEKTFPSQVLHRIWFLLEKAGVENHH